MTGGTPDVEQHVETSPNGRYIRYSFVLGKGAYKTVYKAFDTEEALEVAWNKLHVDRLNEHDLEKVSNEVSLLRQVNHKNIIHFYDTWRGQDANDNQTINFITEQMMSGTLKEYLRKAKAIKLKVIRRWCSNILEAIAYLHSQDPPIMHRDLKCDNIFINGHVGEVKIGDLGLSGVKEREKADSVIGTPEFMAPELYEESYTEKVDIYAFGMCLLEIVSMEYPYSECNNMAQIFKKVFNGEKPHAFDTLIDGDVKNVINACLQREARRPSAMDLLEHQLFSEWEKDDGVKSNLSLVKGSIENVPADTSTAQSSRSMPIGTELIDWSDPLRRNVFVSMLEGEGVKDNQEVSVIATKENGGFYIGLEIPIRDAIKRVEFTFDPFEDSSQYIAHEMVSEFDLGTEQLSVIQDEIELQVKIAKSQREAASRNATPQPAAKKLEPTSASPSRSSQSEAKSQATTIMPSSGASQPEQSSVSAQHSLTHSEQESVSATAAEHLSHHHVPEKIEHQRDAALQQPIQSRIHEVPQNVVQDHPVQDESISSDLTAPRQVSEEVQPIQEGQARQKVPAEQLVERTGTTLATKDRTPDGMEHNMQQMQSFVHEAIKDPLPALEATPSSQPLAQAFAHSVDANVTVPEAQGSEAESAQVSIQHTESQIIQHAEHHAEHHVEPQVRHPVPHPLQQETLPQKGLQSPSDRIRDTQASSQGLENKTIEQQIDVAPETTELRASPSFGEVTTGLGERDSDQKKGLAPKEAPMTDVSDSFAVSQRPIDTHTHDAHEQDVLTTHVDHRVHEQQRQTLPHTSSFVSSQAQSPSVETPSGARSPVLPPDGRIASAPILHATATGVLESVIPPPTHETLLSESESHENLEEDHISVSSGVMNSVGNATSVQEGLNLKTSSSVEHATYPALDEVMHRVNSFPQQQVSNTVSSEGHAGDHSRRHASNVANRFPQSVSDDVLPAPSRVTIIDPPTRPPSTPITPASPGRDFTEEHQQASPPTVRTMLQGAGVEPMSQIHSVAVQGENYLLNSQPRTRESADERSNANVNSKSRSKSGSRPAIVVVSSEPSGSSGESSRRGGAERPSKLLSEFVVPDILPSSYSGGSDHTNRRQCSPDRPGLMTLSASQLGDYPRGEQSSSQPSPPGTDQFRTSSWMSLQSDDTSGSTGFRDPTSAATGRGLVTGKHDQESYTRNLKLMDSCARGVYEEVALKLKQGASANFADYDKRTPLHLAATEGHVSICVLLIEQGADVNAKDRWGQTPLSNANEGKSAEVKELLVAKGAVDESTRSVEVLSMELMQQSAQGDLEAVRQKIIAGALVTFQYYDQRTPLHLACSEGHAEVAEVLLMNGASPSAIDRKGRSPVDDAIANGHRSVVRVLKQYGASVPRHIFETEPDLLNQKGMDLLELAGHGRIEDVSECLSQGASAKYGDYDHRTALHLACSGGHLDVVRILLQAGADTRVADRWGSTPIDSARKAGFTEIVEELNRWDTKRTQRQAPSISFDHSRMMNGHGSVLHADKEIEGSHFDHFGHGIATSVSLGAMPFWTVSADDFVAEYPASSMQDPLSAANSNYSLPLTPFEPAEDISRIGGNRSSEEILLQQAYNARKRQLEEEHRRAFEELFRKKSMEPSRSLQASPDPPSARPSASQVPMSPMMNVSPQDTTRSVSPRGEYGKIPNGNATRMESRHNGGTSRVLGNTGTDSLSSARIGGATYLMNEDMNTGTGSQISGENTTIRNIVDGLVDAAVSSNS